MNNFWYVYKHIRLDKNEPFYIGIGSIANYRRAYDRKSRNKIWHNIVSKTEYTIDIINDNLSEIDAKNIEKELIFKYGKIINGGILSNITDGGDGTNGMLHSDETKLIIKEKRKNQIFSEETKLKLSKVRLGNKYALGKKHSSDINDKKSLNMRGKFGGTILMEDIFGDKKEFSSIKDASDKIGVSYKNIWYACTKRLGKLYKGYYWSYKDDRQYKNNTIIPYEFLYEEYVVKKRSVPNISIELNCSENKIYRILKKHNLMNI